MPDTIQIMAKLVAAFVSNNATPAADVPNLMKAAHAALNGAASSDAEEPATKPMPAVQVKKSVHHDYIVSLEDGKRYKTLRRHLSALGMSPDDYRAKWGLTTDYPMIARGYSERRSALAKSLGLGRKPVEPVAPPIVPKKPHSKPKASVAAELPVEGAQAAAEGVQEAA